MPSRLRSWLFQVVFWFRSLHAKLFLLTAAVTTFTTLAIAFNIIRTSRHNLENYTKALTTDVARTVETEVLERDPRFENEEKIDEILTSLAGPERSIFQIDIFKRVGRDEVVLVRSSGDENEIDWGRELASYLNIPGPDAQIVMLNTGDRAWKVYLPIRNPKAGKPSIGLIRAYCDLERWDAVWDKNRKLTYRLLPPVLLGEFILLWLVMRIFLRDPLDSVLRAMEALAKGASEARVDYARKDEVGLIAQRFNEMASELQRASLERETLIHEIQILNANLQNEVKQAREEVQAQADDLAKLREDLSQMERLAVAGTLTAVFAHEVGTPLNLVGGHLQLLLGQKDLSDRSRDRLTVIRHQIQRIHDIVRRLLDVTRRPRLNLKALDLGALIAELEQLWAPSFTDRQVRLVIQLPSNCRIQADRKQMEQLFLNLVNNALDAMPKGGLITLEAEFLEAKAQWIVRIKDEGHGIPEDIQDQVFRPMFTTKPEGQGTGLGLPICKEIVRSHGGEISLQSQPGKGTTVSFTLPSAES